MPRKSEGVCVIRPEEMIYTLKLSLAKVCFQSEFSSQQMEKI